MIELRKTEDGILIPVRARAGAKRNAIEGEYNGLMKVSVTAAPEKGKANQAIVALLSELFEVPKSAIEVVAGKTSSRKEILVRGITESDVQAAVRDH
ncbi:MAG: DUF167 domain-containing protein [Pirellulales bacterium]|nr:DUF167 domain-containing protein [Pirellulales bacterium]